MSLSVGLYGIFPFLRSLGVGVGCTVRESTEEEHQLEAVPYLPTRITLQAQDSEWESHASFRSIVKFLPFYGAA